MEIDLLYVPDCPHRDVARDLVNSALAQTGHKVVVRERAVHSLAEAERLGMRGSPTILIDGEDPFAAGGGPVAMACRLYRSAEGLSSFPTVSQLVEAFGG
jgi:hypothetical protein